MPNITMQQIADMAGVSLKTVSRVVNKESGVKQSTREKIEALVEKYDFQPNPSARGLASSRSYLIGLLYKNPSASYIIGLQDGALAACRAHKYGLLIHPCDHEDPGVVDTVNQLARHSRVDGLLLTPPLCDMEPLLEMLERRKLKYVRISPLEHNDRSPFVFADEEQAAFRMTEYLLSQGHMRIGFITGAVNRSGTEMRLAGYRKSLANHNIDCEDSLVVEGDYSYESGEMAARKLLRLQDRPTAIFASNDYMASGVLKVAAQMGVRVPHDLSVAGYDDAPLAQRLWPRLTTIHHHVEQMTQAATEILIRHLNDGDTEFDPESIYSELIVRESTAPLLR
jgi:LacI family transcriptional regulator